MYRLDQSCRDFAITYLASSVILIALAAMLSVYHVPLSGLALLLPMVLSSFLAGSRFGERTGGRPAQLQAWRFSLVVTLLTTGMLVAVVGGTMLTVGAPARGALDAIVFQPGMLVLLVGMIAAVHLLAVRYLFDLAAMLGARSRRLATIG